MGAQRLIALSDPQLEALTRDGDLAAYAELWERHARAGIAAARQFSSIADPDDIVSEAYLLILRALQRGGGPSEAFRPYLYRTIRNVALDWRAKIHSVPLDDAAEHEDPAPGPESTAIRSTITTRAFKTLPERWQTVLWYTEVEGLEPAEAAPHLGMTSNAVSALAYRAREGLKKAWLQAHVNEYRIPEECRWTTQRMGDYTQGSLSRAAASRFDTHLETCTRCAILVEEIEHLSGRLAAVLLPIVLGGSAAAGLIASQQFGQAGGAYAASGAAPSPDSSAANSASATEGAPVRSLANVRSSRLLLAAAAVAIASVTAAAIVIAATKSPPYAPVASSTDEPVSPAPPQSLPLPSPQPSTTATPAEPDDSASPEPAPATPQLPREPVESIASPVTSPIALPVAEEPSTPEISVTPLVFAVAPAAPVLVAPAIGTVTRSATPLFDGEGTAGASIAIGYVDGTTLMPLTSTVVSPESTWSVTSATPIPDGVWELEITQTLAGLSSAPMLSTLVVDTVALPPTVNPLAESPLIYLPHLTGNSEPEAAIELHDNVGTLVATATADAAGAWAVDLPDRDYTNSTIAAQQTDVAGNQSTPSTPELVLDFVVPTIAAADGTTIVSDGGATTVALDLAGLAGYQVQVFIDGESTGNMHMLEASPISRIAQNLSDGMHTFGVRYANSDGRVGPTVTHALTIAP